MPELKRAESCTTPALYFLDYSWYYSLVLQRCATIGACLSAAR